MRIVNVLTCSLAAAVLGAACGGKPSHRIQAMRFSDSRAFGALLAASDTFDHRFELSRVQYVHAHLDVTYPYSWLQKSVSITCTIAGPETGQVQKVERNELLPRRTSSTTWIVPLRTAMTTWSDGRYKVSCQTPVSSIEDAFEIVDTTELLAKAATPPTMKELLGTLNKGNPSPTLPKARPTPPLTRNSPLWGDIFKHEHKDLRPPASPAPAPAPSPPVPPAVRTPVVLRPTIFATDTSLGPVGDPADRFDAATLKHVGYSIHVPDLPAVERGDVGLCVFERRRTGVVRGGARAVVITPLDNGVALKGTTGNNEPGQWIPGEYQVRCEPAALTVEPRSFTVFGRSQPNLSTRVLGQKIAFQQITAKSIRVFETPYEMTAVQNREYFMTAVGTPRYVATEAIMELAPSDRPRSFSYTCHYFTVQGAVIGRSSVNVEIPPGASERTVAVAWGNRQATFWQPGSYFTECDANGVFLGSRFFAVER